MCGIIGIAGKGAEKTESNTIESMLSCLDKRGPDDKGFLVFPECILGQTRLSIIDIAGGHQPMRDNENPLTIVFNGEIYNYKELRVELETKGHTFSTHSDTEVILKAYIEYGEACPTHLDGMFTFAIWDEPQKKLLLARDRFGEKPLYFSETDGLFYFASEIKALIASKKISAVIDKTSVDNYLTFLFVPPWRSIYKDIHPLEPAHTLTYKEGQVTKNRYWEITHDPIITDFDTASETVKTLLSESVKSRMIADVEVGTFLSGGIDSGIVTILAAKEKRDLKSFSAGFEYVINELPQAKEISLRAKTDHYEKNITTLVLESLMKVSAYFDEPFADSSIVPTNLISEFAHQKVKVALSGDGGDELFCGYGHYRKYSNLPKVQKAWNFFFSDPWTYYKKRTAYYSTIERKKLWKFPETVEHDPLKHVNVSAAQTPIQKMQLADIYLFLPGDMLTKVDRSSMLHSLEIRSPFLNHRLAEFAFNLPDEFKTSQTHGKLILERAFSDNMPSGFFKRKKQGFGAPVCTWLQTPELRTYIEQNLLESGNPIYSFFNKNEVAHIVKSFYQGDFKLHYKVWILLCFELWCKTHKYSL
jgi:asparagine synthase (glutamine-hydrolysing)